MNDSTKHPHDGAPPEDTARTEPADGDPGAEVEAPASDDAAGAEAAAAAEGEPAGGRPRGEGGASTVAELELSLEDDQSEEPSGPEEEDSVSREIQLSSQIDRLQAEADANRDKWLRAMAEFENFRKRNRREMESTINLARAGVLRQLLDVLDNFDRALSAAESSDNAPGADFVHGVRLIQDQLLKVLKENGVSRIDADQMPFDPNLHEAVSQIETDEVLSQHVAQVVKDGYLMNDMVLRPAMVVVAE